MAMKLKQAGLGNKLSNEIKFMSNNSKHEGMQNINILSRHKQKIRDWDVDHRNKYACDRWINDSRGCGYGCLVSKKRFIY